jgi:hypothetical protein
VFVGCNDAISDVTVFPAVCPPTKGLASEPGLRGVA